MLYKYRCKNMHSGFRDMRSTNSVPHWSQVWSVIGPWASPCGDMGKWQWHCTQFHRTLEKIHPAISEIRVLQSLEPAIHPDACCLNFNHSWKQYPFRPKYGGVKIHWVFSGPFQCQIPKEICYTTNSTNECMGKAWHWFTKPYIIFIFPSWNMWIPHLSSS